MSACGLCSEAITNPICTQCLGDELMVWVAQVKPELEHELRELISVFYALEENETWCIRCRNHMRACAHCAMREVQQFLESTHPDLITDFVDHFNFELATPFDEVGIRRPAM